MASDASRLTRVGTSKYDGRQRTQVAPRAWEPRLGIAYVEDIGARHFVAVVGARADAQCGPDSSKQNNT